jgi:hypothetical protein
VQRASASTSGLREIVVEGPVGRELVHVRRLYAAPQAPVTTELTEARVVQDNDDYVGLRYGRYLISPSLRACHG